MAYYAKIEGGNNVIEVIVAEQEFIDTLDGTWIETSYTGSIRKNYATRDGIYDSARDAFYTKQPWALWTLDESTCLWEAPTVYPDDGKDYDWNEATTNWVEVE